MRNRKHTEETKRKIGLATSNDGKTWTTPIAMGIANATRPSAYCHKESGGCTILMTGQVYLSGTSGANYIYGWRRGPGDANFGDLLALAAQHVETETEEVKTLPDFRDHL